MKKTINKLLIFVFSILSTLFAFAQSEQCGTMQNLEFQLKNNPDLRAKLDSIERHNEIWIKKNNRGFKDYAVDNNVNRIGIVKSNSSIQNINSLCGYDNTFYTTINAPTALNQIISPSNNCTWGGEYVRVNNLIAGNTYRISTIGLNNFDTTLSIFLAGGGNPVAYNDDWNGSAQSEIYFTPFVSGNYDILIDQYGCLSNQLCASLQVELWYIPRPVITIPVVVHVIHKGEPVGTGTNISNAQIQSQIDILNQDFRRLNSDILLSPAPFRGSSTDPLIQFCLAQQKPDGSPTNGIMRYLEPSQQDYASWILQYGGNLSSDYHCFNQLTLTYFQASTIWNRDKYLNFWVSDKLRQLPAEAGAGAGNNLGCNFERDALGIAQFPGETGQPLPILPNYSLTDGVWITSTAFGNTGNVIPPFNFGKTAVHEVGHWLNLKHIWGDEPMCTQDDLILDTPLQSIKSFGCNSFPKLDSCTSILPGVMFMNYMDYSDDNCLSIFTFGQSARMDSALFNQRASLLTSIGCNPSTMSIDEISLGSNIKTYPNPFNNKLTIEANEPIFKVEIYNLLGQKIKNIEINNPTENSINIELSELSQGNYLAKVFTEFNVESIKIIKE